jgi:hypothetical protein
MYVQNASCSQQLDITTSLSVISVACSNFMRMDICQIVSPCFECHTIAPCANYLRRRNVRSHPPTERGVLQAVGIVLISVKRLRCHFYCRLLIRLNIKTLLILCYVIETELSFLAVDA